MLPVVRLILDFTDHKSVTYNGDSDTQILCPKTLNANLPIKYFNRKQLRNKNDSTKRHGNKTEILYSLLRVRFIQHSESLKYVCLQCYCKVRHCRPCFLKGPVSLLVERPSAQPSDDTLSLSQVHSICRPKADNSVS